MMSPTHVAAGLAIAAAVAVYEPGFGLAAAVGGAVGGALPDVDLFVGDHRKTLHFPVYAWLPTAGAAAVALAAPTSLSVGIAVGCLAFAVHSASDVLGAGEELRPWERTNPYAVYCHACRRWLRARYVVRYDGAPEDVLATAVLAAPTYLVFDGTVRTVVGGIVLLGAAYAAVRKRVVPYFEAML
jgi:hypothetical protein